MRALQSPNGSFVMTKMAGGNAAEKLQEVAGQMRSQSSSRKSNNLRSSEDYNQKQARAK